MSDFASSLPVRTETNGDVAVKVVDGTIVSQALAVNASGQISISNFPTLVDTNYGAVGASTIRSAAQVGNATGAADFNNGATTAQTLRTASNIYDSSGTAFSTTNPLPVNIIDSAGTAVNDYKNATAIAAAATDNHDYTVTAGKTLHLNQVEASSSGKAKMDVTIETAVASGVFTTRWSMFNSTATPQMQLEIKNTIQVAAGVRVRIVMTNEDKASQNLYSTISGFEV